MSKLISPPEWQSGLLQEFTILPEEEPKSELWINTRAGAGVKSTVFFRCWIISGISREWQHRCRSKQTFGGANDFCPNFPKLARKAVLRLLPTDARSWRPVAILRGAGLAMAPPVLCLAPRLAPPVLCLARRLAPPVIFLISRLSSFGWQIQGCQMRSVKIPAILSTAPDVSCVVIRKQHRENRYNQYC